MTRYSMAATVKAMKIQEVILKAASGEILWIEAADIIGVSYRTMKRWKSRYEKYGYDGIFDRRMRSPSPKQAPFSEVQTILRLYRAHYKGFNATHFHEKLQEHHNIRRGYTFVKKLLQTAGEIDKTRKRDKHRQKRPRKPLPGMMLHLDGSPHEWISAQPGVFYDLLTLMDDATNRIYEMRLVDEEDTHDCMLLLRDCVAKHGIFCSLYSDRAPHFFYTPKAGEKVQEGHLTQIGRALNELGVRMIPAYSPQARGRGERMNQTLQGRIVNELRLHNIKTKEDANRFFKDHYIAELNKRFAKPPEQKGSAFLPLAKHIYLDLIFSIKSERTVNQDNTVSYQNRVFQIAPSNLRVSFAKSRVTVHEHLDQSVSITYGPHLLGYYAPNNISKNPKKQNTLCLV